MSHNNENGLETFNICDYFLCCVGYSEIVVQGAFKFCISLDAINNFVFTIVQKNQRGMALYTSAKGNF